MEIIKQEDAISIWLCSIAGGVMGWAYETAYDGISRHMLTLRESLILPWCPIYAVGVALIIAVLRLLKLDAAKLSWAKAFALSAAVATATELAGSYLIGALSGGHVPWDYSSYFMNFQGRIALWPAFLFGVGGAAVLKAILPRATAFAESEPAKARWLSLAILGACIGDMALEAVGSNDVFKEALSEIPWVCIQGVLE